MNQGVLCRNCESCGIEINVLDLTKQPDIILCDLCQPWVLNSIYEVPKQSTGIHIEDPLLFKVSLKLTENLQTPMSESDWYLFLTHIFSKEQDSPDEESEMLTKIRLDYAGRQKIYDPEAHDLYYGPGYNEYDTSQDIGGPFNGLHPFFDDPTVHFDFMIDLRSLIISYIKSLEIIDAEKKHLKENGWGSYAKQMSWSELEPEIHDLYGTKLLTSQLLDCLDLVKTSESIGYGLIGQLIFDFACDEGQKSLKNWIYMIKKISKTVDKCKLDYPPTSPFFYRVIANLVRGKYGQNLQYLMLASLFHWQRTLRPSHHFLVRDEVVWSRSFKLLRGIITSLGLKRANIKRGKILIKGDTNIWYSIRPAVFRTELQCWLVSNAKTRRGICIDILEAHKDLPIADQLASVVLTLANDGLMTHEVHTIEHTFQDQEE